MIIKQEIVELLEIKPMTSNEIFREIAKKTSISIENLRSYISVLSNEDNIIEKINDKKPYKYRAKTPKRYLIEFKKGFEMLNTLFKEFTKTEITKENLKILAKKHLDIQILTELEEMI